MNLIHEGVLPPDEPDFRDERREEDEARRNRETPADIASEMCECAVAADPAIWGDTRIAGLVRKTRAQQIEYAKRIGAAWKRELDEIVSAVSELKDGMCIHCDLQQQCAEGEDGMPTTCNAMVKVRNFLQRYEKPEVNDGLPF